jgi:hypothetical protein
LKLDDTEDAVVGQEPSNPTRTISPITSPNSPLRACSAGYGSSRTRRHRGHCCRLGTE